MKHLLKIIILIWFVLPSQTIAGKVKRDSTGYFTSFDKVKIYYEDKGNGPVVVLVHGFIVNGESWKRTALYQNLLKNGYRVITMDLRGNGKSDKPHDSTAYANDAEAKDLMGLLDFLGVKKYSVIGYSRGSIITARLMILDPRVTQAVMGGMGLDFTNPDWPRRKMFYRALAGDNVPELESMVKYVKESGLDQKALCYLQLYQPSTPITELKKFQKPILVICGDKDTDNGNAAELAVIFQNGKYVTVPGVHNDAYHTAEFSKQIMEFLSK